MRIDYSIDMTDFPVSCLNAIRDFLVRTNDYTLVTDIITYTQNNANFSSHIEVEDYPVSRPYFNSSYKYFVAHSELNDVYLIFMYFNHRVGMFVSTEWDENEEIFYQKDVIFNDFYSNRSDITNNGASGALAYNQNFAYYIPMPTIGTCDRLVANYNPENETVMFSGLEPLVYDFGAFSTSQNLTHSICFGNLTKYGNWDNDGGFWYGGDGVCSLELYFRASVYNARASVSDEDYTYTYYTSSEFKYADIYWQYESNCTKGLDFHIRGQWSGEGGYLQHRYWYDDPFSLVSEYRTLRLPDTVNHFNRFECFLKINMDEFPNRPTIENAEDEYDRKQVTQRRLPRYTDYDSDIFGKYCYLTHFKYTKTKKDTGESVTIENSRSNILPIVVRKQIWATTTLSNYYVPMVSSIDNVSKGLPSYWSLMSSSRTDVGHTVNDLNNISLVIRMYLMVQRDPQVLNDFSCVGYNDVINYVNMKNMSTNAYLNGTYPVKTSYYNCFQTGIRRSDLGFKGYSGLAFKMVQDVDVGGGSFDDSGDDNE